MKWILERLVEPSTWIGLSTVLGSIGVAVSPELVVQIGVIVAAIIGAIQITKREKVEEAK